MNFKKITSLVISALVFSSTTTVFASSNKLHTKRIYGENRYETSVKVSRDKLKTSSYAVICRGDNFPDALCAVPLAKKYNAPILLIGDGKLQDGIKSEIKRLNVQNVFITGGEGVINKNIENEIKSLKGINKITRFGGKDRYETSELVAEEVNSKGEIVLTSGTCPADALSISSIAANKGIPIILAKDKKIVTKYLSKNKINKSYIIGGETCVSKDIEHIVPNSERIYGQNRYETNEKIIERFSNTLNFKNIYITLSESERGDEFADALTGGALASRENNPIILVGKDIYENTKIFIKSKITKESTIVVLGGEQIIPTSIPEQLYNDKVFKDDVKDTNNNEKDNSSSNKTNSSSSHNHSSSSSSSHAKPDKQECEYKFSMQSSFPGSFTYDVKIIGKNEEGLKGYKLLYDGDVIANDEDNDGIVRPLTIFFGKATDKSKFKIVKGEKEILFTGLTK